MVRISGLPGSVLTSSEGGSGKGRKLALVALLVAAIVLVLRRRSRGSDGIDRVETYDADDEEEDTEREEIDRVDTDDDTEEDDDRSVSVEIEESSGGRLNFDTSELDLFDLIAVVGAAYKAARAEYESRQAGTETAEV